MNSSVIVLAVIFALQTEGYYAAIMFPSKPKLVLESEFNEAAEHQLYSDKLDKIMSRLENFYSNFQSVRKETLNQIDSLTGLLTSRKSIDQMKTFVNSKMNMQVFRAKIREALKEKMTDEESSNRLLQKISELANPPGSLETTQQSTPLQTQPPNSIENNVPSSKIERRTYIASHALNKLRTGERVLRNNRSKLAHSAEVQEIPPLKHQESRPPREIAKFARE